MHWFLHKIYRALHFNWKKAKQPYFSHRQQTRPYQLDTVLCLTSGHRWLGFRFLTFPCSLYLFNWRSFNNQYDLVLKTWREEKIEKKIKRKFSFYWILISLKLYFSVHWHLRRSLCSMQNLYKSHIFKNIGVYSILHHFGRKAKWTNKNPSLN